MYLRILFAVALLAVSVMLGRAKAKKLDLRHTALNDFLGFARQLEVLIRANGRAIPDALRECSRRLAGKWTASFASGLAELYRSKSSAGLWAMTLKAVAGEYEEAASLSAEDGQMIALFGDQLASADMKSIATNYELLYNHIEESLQSSERDRAVKGKLYNTVGILAGLAAAVIVI